MRSFEEGGGEGETGERGRLGVREIYCYMVILLCESRAKTSCRDDISEDVAPS